MKKLVCVVVAMFYLCGVAFAENSPTLGALTQVPETVEHFLITAENLDDAAAAGMFVEMLNEFSAQYGSPEYELVIAISDEQLALLSESETPSAYFGPDGVIAAANGSVLPLTDFFGGKEPIIVEFGPVIAGGYQLAYGRVSATLLFVTPFQPDQKVVVLIGVLDDEEYTVEDDLKDVPVTWYAFEGTTVEVPGVEGAYGIQVHFEPEMIELVQNKDTLCAVAVDPDEVDAILGNQ